MILSEYFLNRKIRALTKAAGTRECRYRTLAEVKKVLILCENTDRKAVEACVRTLVAMKKTVYLCIYVRKQENIPVWDQNCLPVNAEKDINFWGFPNSMLRHHFCRLPADMLLDLTGSVCPTMRYLMLLHPSSFKVGAKRAAEDDLYDFSIVMNDDMYDLSFLFRQVMNYLQVIRSGNS